MSISPFFPLTIHREALPDGTSFNMVEVQGGQFRMGDDNEKGYLLSPAPAHTVTLDTYYLGQYPVTQGLWESVMGNNPAHFQSENLPVESVSWYDAIEFCNRLSEICKLVPVYEVDKTRRDPQNQSEFDALKWWVRIRAKASGYRLPTEAEWEFAARGGQLGSDNTYSGSIQLERVGWYDHNSHRESQPVGLKAPNELGVFDMSGSIWEWCGDWREKYEAKPAHNPTGPESGSYRVLRGGSRNVVASLCRVAYRFYRHPVNRGHRYGFRLSRTAL